MEDFIDTDDLLNEEFDYIRNECESADDRQDQWNTKEIE